MSLRGAQIGSQSFSFEEGEVGTSGGSGCHVCARSLRLKATKARSKRSICCLLSAFCSLKNSVRCLIDESFESILEISAACLARSSLQLGTSDSIPRAANNQYDKGNPANQQWRRLRISRETKQHCRTCGDPASPELTALAPVRAAVREDRVVGIESIAQPDAEVRGFIR